MFYYNGLFPKGLYLGEIHSRAGQTLFKVSTQRIWNYFVCTAVNVFLHLKPPPLWTFISFRSCLNCEYRTKSPMLFLLGWTKFATCFWQCRQNPPCYFVKVNKVPDTDFTRWTKSLASFCQCFDKGLCHTEKKSF